MNDAEAQGVCECCNRRLTSLWTVPGTHSNAAMNKAATVMQVRRARNICRREMAPFPPLPPPREPTPRARAYEKMLKRTSVQALKNMMLELALPLDTTKSTPLKATMVKALADQDKEDAGEAPRGPPQSARPHSTPSNAPADANLHELHHNLPPDPLERNFRKQP